MKILNNKENNYRELYAQFNSENLPQAISSTLYYCDKNEINSHMNEMIPFLEKHKEINFKNFRKYIKNIPGYDVITKLKSIASVYNTQYMYNKNRFSETIGKIIYDNVYKNNPHYINSQLTPVQCVKLLRNKINNTVLYSEKQFYKILTYTLDKLQRESKYRWQNGISDKYYNIFDEYRKIINS